MFDFIVLSNKLPIRKIFCLFLFILALGLRLYHYDFFDLWHDEIGNDLYGAKSIQITAELTDTPAIEVFTDMLMRDPHSPIYNILVYLYSVLIGDGMSLRLMSVFFSMMALIVLWYIAHHFVNPRVGFYTLLIMAVNPFHLWYAQEARGYAMAVFVCLVWVYFYLKVFQTDRRGHWVMFTVMGFMAVLSNYFAVFLLLFSFIPLLTQKHRSKLFKWILSIVIILIVIFALKALFSEHMDMVRKNFWLISPRYEVFLFAWMIFGVGYSGSNYFHFLLSFLFFFSIACYGIFALFKVDKVQSVSLSAFLFCPVIIMFYLSRWILPVFVHRQLIIFSPFYYLLMACGIDALKKKHYKVICVIIFCAFQLPALTNYYKGYAYPRGYLQAVFMGTPPKRQASEILDPLPLNMKEGDIVVAANFHSYVLTRQQVYRHYAKYRDKLPESFYKVFFPYGISAFEIFFLGMENEYDIVDESDPLQFYKFTPFKNDRLLSEFNIEDLSFNRLWLVYSMWIKDGLLDQETKTVRDLFYHHFKRVDVFQKDGVWVEVYINEPASIHQIEEKENCVMPSPQLQKIFDKFTVNP